MLLHIVLWRAWSSNPPGLAAGTPMPVDSLGTLPVHVFPIIRMWHCGSTEMDTMLAQGKVPAVHLPGRHQRGGARAGGELCAGDQVPEPRRGRASGAQIDVSPRIRVLPYVFLAASVSPDSKLRRRSTQFRKPQTRCANVSAEFPWLMTIMPAVQAGESGVLQDSEPLQMGLSAAVRVLPVRARHRGRG